jgi:hypothetical protein
MPNFNYSDPTKEIMERANFKRLTNLVQLLSESNAINLGGHENAKNFTNSNWKDIRLHVAIGMNVSNSGDFTNLLDYWGKNPSSFVAVLDAIDTKNKARRVTNILNKILNMSKKDIAMEYDVQSIKEYTDEIVASLKKLEKNPEFKGSLDDLFQDWRKNPFSFLEFLKVKPITEGPTEAFLLKDENGDDRVVRRITNNGFNDITTETSKNFIETLNKIYVKGKFEDKIKIQFQQFYEKEEFPDFDEEEGLPDIIVDNKKSGYFAFKFRVTQ